MTGKLLPFDAIRSNSGVTMAAQHESPRRLQSRVQIDGGQNRFQRVHQKRGLVAAAAFFLAPSQVQIVSQLQFLGHADQVLFAHQVGSQLGEFSFAKAGKAIEQFFGGDKSEDGIAHKLQLFVVADARASGGLQRFQFAGLGAVGQGLLQQFGTRELVSQGGLQERNVT